LIIFNNVFRYKTSESSISTVSLSGLEYISAHVLLSVTMMSVHSVCVAHVGY